jgi:membrane protease YdiL (CAAX protease family)
MVPVPTRDRSVDLGTVPRRRGRAGRIFLDPEERLRTGCRLLAYLAAWVFAIAGVSGLLVGDDPTPVRQFLGLAVSVPVIVAVTYAFRRWVDRRGWDRIGLSVPRWQHLWQWGAGFAAGVLVIAALFAVQWALGWVEVAGTEFDDRGAGPVVWLLAGGLALHLAVAFSEEVGFRGYVFQNLAGTLSVRNATLATGLLFGAAHLPAATALASGPTWVAGLNLLVGGTLISSLWVLTRLSTGTLWPAIGMHAAWNWAETSGFGLATAEPDYGNALLHLRYTGPDLMVGYQMPEAGLLFTVAEALLLAGYWLWVRRDRRAGPRVISLKVFCSTG